MVERIGGDGRHFRDILQELGRDRDGHHNQVVFADSLESQGKIAQELARLSELPEIDDRTVLLEDVIDGSRQEVRVLSGPPGYQLRDIHEDKAYTNDMPSEIETYSVLLIHAQKPYMKREELVLVDNAESATRIATRKARLSGWNRRFFTAVPKLITPEEFVLAVKDRIDDGERVEPRLLAYAGLKEYSDKKQSKKNAIQSDIV